MTQMCELDMKAEERTSRMNGILEYNPICGVECETYAGMV